MDVAMDLYLAVPLLFTALAIVLASVFVRLRRGEGERAAATELPPEPAAVVEPDQEEKAGAAVVPEEKRDRGPVEELGAGDEGKKAAGEQRVATAEPHLEAEPSAASPRSIPRGGPAESSPREDPAESSPRGVPIESIPLGGPAETSPRGSLAEGSALGVPAESIPLGGPDESRPQGVPIESIPLGGPAETSPQGGLAEGSARGVPAESSSRQPPAETRDDAESTIPPLIASSGSSLGHMEQVEDGCGPTALSSTAEEKDLDLENEKLVVKEPGDEDAADEMFSFKYSPGKLRGNQYKSMMTKEELEEEQRVQREQLAAIFRLMKEKSDTFGEMSEGDMKEQLRLYDI